MVGASPIEFPNAAVPAPINDARCPEKPIVVAERAPIEGAWDVRCDDGFKPDTWEWADCP